MKDTQPIARISNRPNFAFPFTKVEIATGVITLTERSGSYFFDTEAAAASDDLDTITDANAVDGDVIIVSQFGSARDITYKDGTGNLFLAGDYTPGNAQSRLTLHFFNGDWYELSRSTN